MTRGAEATPESTLLQIKRKEIELQTLLLATRRQADEILAAARDEAEARRREAEAAADLEAERIREAELAAARERAERIRREYDQHIAALGRGDDVIGRLAAQIRSLVAPGSG